MKGTHLCDRVAIPWSEPFLPRVAEWLRGQTRDTPNDFRRWTLVVTGRRAGRTLLAELLRDRATPILPPTLTTPGRLFRDISPDGLPPATAKNVHLAWIESLQALDDADRAALARCLLDDDAHATVQLVDALVTLEHDCSTADRTIADVAEIMRQHADASQRAATTARWAVITRCRDDVRRRLADAGRAHPLDMMPDAMDDEARLALVGVTELSAHHRRCLDAIGDRVTALVHAPQENGVTALDGFDAYGALVVDAWHDREPPIDDEQIIVAQRPSDQVDAMLHVLRDWSADVATNDVTIGVADASLVSRTITRSAWAGVGVHHAEGVPLHATRPAFLLDAIADWLDETRFTTFAALLRHPDLLAWLSRTLDAAFDTYSAAGRWITLLDTYYEEHLDGRLDGQWLGSPGRALELKRVHDRIGELLAPLRSPTMATVDVWIDRLLAVLREIYANVHDDAVDAREREEAACLAIRAALVDLADAPAGLQPSMSAGTAIRLILHDLRGSHVPIDPRPSDIDALGWLELAHDPAPALILLGMNEGMVPTDRGNDPLVPDAVRSMLQLPGDRERIARDTFVFCSLLAARRRLVCICGQRSADDDTLLPSRLLLRNAGEARARRVLECMSIDRPRTPLHCALPSAASTTSFTIPELRDDLTLPKALPVTAFSLLLECPYRFALRYVYRIQSHGDRDLELTANQFGTLAHDVLSDFAHDATMIDCTDAEQLRAFLRDTLEGRLRRRYGTSPLAAVRLQVARLAERLDDFAYWQVRERQAGWRIVHAEEKLDDACTLSPLHHDDVIITIRGTIDRIDQHEDGRRWRILDYKTGESAKRISDARNTQDGTWLDLQLPLYRHFATVSGLATHAEVGYISLPSDRTGIATEFADWSDVDVDDAIKTARRALHDFLEGSYRRPAVWPSTFDDFDRICQTTILSTIDDDGDETVNA